MVRSNLLLLFVVINFGSNFKKTPYIQCYPQSINCFSFFISTSRVQDERRKLSKVEEKHQEECDKIKDDMSGEILRVQAQCDEKISEYETKLELAHGNRMSSMFQMKEEVESEFTGRMEQVSFFLFTFFCLLSY